MSLHHTILHLTTFTCDRPTEQAYEALRLLRRLEASRSAAQRATSRLPLSLQLRCHNWHRTHKAAFSAVLLAERLSRPGHATPYQYHLAWARAFTALGLHHLADLYNGLAHACKPTPEPHIMRPA